MHELALTQSIVEMVAEHARGHRVRRVALEIGRLTCVLPEALRFCFEVATSGTALEGASLEIIDIEAMARCLACGEVFVQESLWQSCQCGAHDREQITGEELRVKEYELEAAAA
jgi:hydrogenase nickel incorporation protein HypA/HybF